MKTFLFSLLVVVFSLFVPRTLNAAEVVADVTSSPAGGKTVTLTVTAAGTQPFVYSWEKSPNPDAPAAEWNFASIVGATEATLVLPSVTLADAGIYRVRVTNSAGFTISPNAFIRVIFSPTIESYGVTVSGE